MTQYLLLSVGIGVEQTWERQECACEPHREQSCARDFAAQPVLQRLHDCNISAQKKTNYDIYISCNSLN